MEKKTNTQETTTTTTTPRIQPQTQQRQGYKHHHNRKCTREEGKVEENKDKEYQTVNQHMITHPTDVAKDPMDVVARMEMYYLHGWNMRGSVHAMDGVNMVARPTVPSLLFHGATAEDGASSNGPWTKNTRAFMQSRRVTNQNKRQRNATYVQSFGFDPMPNLVHHRSIAWYACSAFPRRFAIKRCDKRYWIPHDSKTTGWGQP